MAKTAATLIHEVSPLLLQESDGDGPFNADGTVTTVVMRPGRARGKGRRVYPRDVLERDAGIFTGWPMFENHESPAARKARGTIPRGPGELAGELRETWFDPTYIEPTDDATGFEPGAVMGKMSPTPLMRSLIESVPNSLKLSIKAYATNLKRGNYNGQPAEICEGIDAAEEGSVDVVTSAGAGGRVLALLESGYSENHVDADHALEEIPDQELLHHMREHRPHLLESTPEPVTEIVPDPTPTPEPPKAVTLADVFASDEFKNTMSELVESRVQERLEDHRTLIESGMVPRRQVELRDLHRIARDVISDSKLPSSFVEDLNLRYGLEESDDGTVTARPSLDVQAEYEGAGDDRRIVKSAKKVLEEALAEDIKRERLKLAEARPTRVHGQGATGVDADEPTVPQPRKGGWRDQLAAAGVDVGAMSKMNSGRLED